MIPAPNYTQMPNVFLDDYAKDMTESELRIALVIMRNTFGWHRDSHKMSLSYFQDATGMTRQGVVNGINGLLEKNIAGRTKSGQSYEYHLIVVNEVDQNECSSQRNRPEVVYFVDPTKKGKKEKICSDERPDPEPQPPVKEEPKRELTEWQLFLRAMTIICHGHDSFDNLTERSKAKIRSEAAMIYQKGEGYTLDELRLWWKHSWLTSWPGNTGDRPEPSKVREQIPTVRQSRSIELTPTARVEVQVPWTD